MLTARRVIFDAVLRPTSTSSSSSLHINRVASRPLRTTTMATSSSPPSSSSSSDPPRVAVVGGGIAGLTCASRLAKSGGRDATRAPTVWVTVTVYETGRGPGGRTSTRQMRDPEKIGWQWDHGAQYVTCKTPTFKEIVDEWRAAGCVAEWTGRFGTVDAATGHFTEEKEDEEKTKRRWVGIPGMNAITAHLATVPGVTVVSSRRVTGFEGGPGGGQGDGGGDGDGGDDYWTVVHRSAGPAPVDDDGNPAPQPATRDGGFAAVVAADKQAASDRSRRVYGESPPVESASAPAVWDGMRAAGQVPSFALMLTVASSSSDDDAAASGAAGAAGAAGAGAGAGTPPLFPFEGAVVLGDGKVGWIANDSSKPGRPTNASANAAAGVQCWVVQSTPEYAEERIKAKLTVPGTSPHQALLAEVADEMLEAVLSIAEKARRQGRGDGDGDGDGDDNARELPKVLLSVAHRWGAAFPTDGAFEAAAKTGGCLTEPSRRVAGCGDFCISPKVEGAALSGAAAASQVLGMLPPIASAL